MNKMLILLTISISFFSNSLLADPIEGTWRVDSARTDAILKNKAKELEPMTLMMLMVLQSRLEEIIFLKDGNLQISKFSSKANWKKSGKTYSIVINNSEDPEDTLKAQVTIEKQNSLIFIAKTPEKTLPTLYFKSYKSPESIIAANIRTKKFIQYGKTYRSEKMTNGGYNYLTINKDNTCEEKAVAKNEHMSANFGGSGFCTIFDGYLVMELGAKAKVISANKIEYMNMIFVAQ